MCEDARRVTSDVFVKPMEPIQSLHLPSIARRSFSLISGGSAALEDTKGTRIKVGRAAPHRKTKILQQNFRTFYMNYRTLEAALGRVLWRNFAMWSAAAACASL